MKKEQRRSLRSANDLWRRSNLVLRLLRPLRVLAMTMIGFLLLSCSVLSADEPHPVILLHVTGIIDPAMARYVERGLEEAQKRQASVVILQIDTPGGLDGSMRKIIQGMLNSPIPVAVYVSPSGARAASAGAFITVAAHVAAMAPGTNIGAAHPVQLGAKESSEGKPSVTEEKMVNDAAAYIRSIAGLKGRKIEWAEGLVRESRSWSAEEAQEKEAIDFIAVDLKDLLKRIDGREVRTVFGVTLLSVQDQPIESVSPSWIEKFLHQVAHPNLAYILLLLGIYGLIYELATPGTVFPGVLGVILIIIALAALETLDVNWAGIFLIIGSVLFFIADIKLPGYGSLTIGGIIAFLIGSAILFPGARVAHLKLSWATILGAATATALFFLIVVGAGIRALKRKVESGIEGLIGAEGTAKTDLKLEGTVHIKGEEWRATATKPLDKGSRVKVVKLEGLTVHVEPVEEKK